MPGLHFKGAHPTNYAVRLKKPVKKLTFELGPSDPKAGIGLNFDVARLADPFFESIYYPVVCF